MVQCVGVCGTVCRCVCGTVCIMRQTDGSQLVWFPMLTFNTCKYNFWPVISIPHFSDQREGVYIQSLIVLRYHESALILV